MNLTARLRLLALFGTLRLWLAADTPKKVASVEGITEYQLDNRLRVLLSPDS